MGSTGHTRGSHFSAVRYRGHSFCRVSLDFPGFWCIYTFLMAKGAVGSSVRALRFGEKMQKAKRDNQIHAMTAGRPWAGSFVTDCILPYVGRMTDGGGGS
jgi:hypothetical protein